MPNETSIERRLPWSFLGFLLGTVSLAVAILLFVLAKRERDTRLEFRVIDEVPLVELREQFPDIKVLYKEDDILDSEKQIKILRLRLSNPGRPILQDLYDQNLPFGVSFDGSRILAATLSSPTSEYLRSNLLNLDDKSGFDSRLLLLNKPIIEKDAEAVLKVHLLQDKDVETTSITALGKISGMSDIPVLPASTEDSSEDESGRSLGEIIGIGFVAGYVGMLALMLSMILVLTLMERRRTKATERKCEEFLQERKRVSETQRRIVASYQKGWRSYYLRTIRALVAGGRALDLSDVAEGMVNRAVGRLPSFPSIIRSKIRRIFPFVWNPDIFSVRGKSISLNKTHKDFIVEFLTSIDQLQIEQGGADQPSEVEARGQRETQTGSGGALPVARGRP